MKKIIVLLLLPVLLLIGCGTPVAITSTPTPITLSTATNTVIPTSTLNPNLLTLQKKITDSGKRFTLNLNGTISDGATTISGLRVTPEGKIFLDVNGKEVEVNSENLHFSDKDGLSIDGYIKNNLDNGWQLNPEMQLQADIEKWQLNLDDFMVGYTEDGKIVLTENSTHKNIYWDGSWEMSYFRKMVVKKDMCLHTEWEGGSVGPSRPLKEIAGFNSRFIKPAVDYLKRIGGERRIVFKNGYETQYFGKVGNCWALRATPVVVNGQVLKEYPDTTYLTWRQKNGSFDFVTVYDENKVNIKLSK